MDMHCQNLVKTKPRGLEMARIMKVFKYDLAVVPVQQISLPDNAKIMTVQFQGNYLCLWAMVDPHKDEEYRYIRIAATGEKITDEPDLKYINTVQQFDGELIWHVFEKIVRKNSEF